jgi:two-component system sensor histidine kinase KdpD
MAKVHSHKLRRSLLRTIPGILLVALVTFICYELGLNITATGFLYLIVVVLQSLFGDFASSAAVSVIADLCLNFFFVPPILSFRVSDSSDTWALISFLITGLIITRLTGQVRRAGEASELQRQEMKSLYELAQRLLALDPRKQMLTKAAALFRSLFVLRAACLYDGVTAELYHDGDSASGLADRTRAAYLSRKDSDDPVSGVFVRPLLVAGNTIGAVGFDGLRDADLIEGPLAALATNILERARVFRDASHASAAVQAEAFRGAILDALAHEFKTPLATIVTAAGGLRESGGLRPEQKELAEIAETEASRLGRLTSRLLRVARLDREEVKPLLELVDIVDLVAHLVREYADRWTDRHLSLTKSVTSVAVLADAELLKLAVRQLLDNAYKYSPSGSAITICLEMQPKVVVVRVRNEGNPIAPKERNRIFERFYRGAEASQVAPGSGLGLYVARKIAQAHGGDVNLEDSEASPAEGITFRLTIPITEDDAAAVDSAV